MSFCSNCGTQIVEGQQFCSNCGTAAGAGPVVPTAPLQVDRSGTALQVPPAVSPQAPPAKSSGSKILIVILLILFFGGAAVVGGVIYVGYRVKQKATAALSNLENDGNKKSSSSKGSSGNSDGSHAGNNDGSPEGGGGNDDNPLSAVLGKLQGERGRQRQLNSRWGTWRRTFSRTLEPKIPICPRISFGTFRIRPLRVLCHVHVRQAD